VGTAAGERLAAGVGEEVAVALGEVIVDEGDGALADGRHAMRTRAPTAPMNASPCQRHSGSFTVEV
jgi:hypothetical protein